MTQGIITNYLFNIITCKDGMPETGKVEKEKNGMVATEECLVEDPLTRMTAARLTTKMKSSSMKKKRKPRGGKIPGRGKGKLLGDVLAGSSEQGILSYFGLIGSGGDGGIPMGKNSRYINTSRKIT